MGEGMKATDILQQHFGYTSFRPGQEEVIEALSTHRDVLAIMPTGAGKSLCFQIPALMSKGSYLAAVVFDKRPGGCSASTRNRGDEY